MSKSKKRHNKLWDRATELYYADPATGPIWTHLSEARKGEWYMKAVAERDNAKQARAALAFCHAYPTYVLEGERDYAERIGQKLIDVAQAELDRRNDAKPVERKPRQPITWSKVEQGPPNVDPPLPSLADLVRRSMDTQATHAAVTTPYVQNGAIPDMDEVTRRGKIVAYNEIKMAMAMRTSDLAVRGDAIHPETAQAMARGVEILSNLLDLLEVPDA